MVFLTYVIIGVAGLYGFMGTQFSPYLQVADSENYPIAQNCVAMFANTEVSAFCINALLLAFSISSYPFNNFIIISGSIKILKDISGKLEMSDQEFMGAWYNFFTILINTIPFLITMFVPYIAEVLGLAGSIVGLFVLYQVPVVTYLVKLRNELNQN